jgi:hypothetical protein
MLASRIRKTIIHSTTQQGNRTIVGGDFNGARFGERDDPRTNGDSLHNVILTASGLRGYSDGIRRAGTCFAWNTEHGFRIDDLLTSPNIPSPHDESTISKIEFPTHSVHIPLISTLKSPTPTRWGRIEQIPPNIEQKRDVIDTDRFTTATHTALTEHLAADATLAAAVIKASQQCDVGDLSLATKMFIEALSASQSRAPLPRKVEPIRPQAGRVHLKRNETAEVHKLQRAAERISENSINIGTPWRQHHYRPCQYHRGHTNRPNTTTSRPCCTGRMVSCRFRNSPKMPRLICQDHNKTEKLEPLRRMA